MTLRTSGTRVCPPPTVPPTITADSWNLRQLPRCLFVRAQTELRAWACWIWAALAVPGGGMCVYVAEETGRAGPRRDKDAGSRKAAAHTERSGVLSFARVGGTPQLASFSPQAGRQGQASAPVGITDWPKPPVPRRAACDTMWLLSGRRAESGGASSPSLKKSHAETSL